MASAIANPIIPGFSPDPSIVRVDGCYFLVNSSFQIYPGLPVYASDDLRNWKHIGNAINLKSQVDLSDASSSLNTLENGHIMVGNGGLFAPTIRYNKGVFYIICTNVSNSSTAESRSLNFIISTRDPWNDEWSNPLYIDFDGIDPSLFFDDDDRAYVQGCSSLRQNGQPASTIKQFEIDIKSGKALSPKNEIWPGYAKYDTESPHIYKKDGYYYLLVAEGGTFENHMLSIARSRNIWGPFESAEKNPVLTASGTDNYIQHVGHGDLFQDANHQWWAVVLGVRKKNGNFPLGRESFLVSVAWPLNEWPQFYLPKQCVSAVYNSMADYMVPLSNPLSVVHPRVDDVYIRNAFSNHYAVEYIANKFSVTMQATSADLSSSSGTVTLWGKRQRKFSCATTVTLVHSSENTGKPLRAGLALYKDHLRHAEIFFDYSSSSICFQGCNEGLKWRASADVKSTGSTTALFIIEAAEEMYKFSFCDDGIKKPVILGVMDAGLITNRDFTGPIFALYATCKGNGEDTSVFFKNFSIKPTSE